jgi:putative tryptophan/tyrosine transport system substrate-binding protein
VIGRAAVALIVVLLGAPLAVHGQSSKVPRLGVLSPGAPGPSLLVDAFRQGLRELGYVEGQNIAIEYRFDEGRSERLPDLAAELARLKVDVIVTVNTAASQAASKATSTIPIVFTYVADPTPLVASLAHPGGNTTGLTTLAAELGVKRLELIKEALPGVSRIGYMWDPSNATATRLFKEAERASPQLGIQLLPLQIHKPDDLPTALKGAVARRASGRIVELAILHRLPAASQSRGFAEAGGLLSYGPSLLGHFRRAAVYVDKILKGAKPGELPVEQPTEFELVVNMKTARALGLRLPPALLAGADAILE